ncbi:MAG: hypothetical protein ACP5IL_13850 [Syntrophobacteraceae bacterium]
MLQLPLTRKNHNQENFNGFVLKPAAGLNIGYLAWTVPLILAVIVGLFTINGRFIQDDQIAILKNPIVVSKSISWSEPFRRDFWGKTVDGPITTWRPLLPIIWRILWRIEPGSPFPFRLLTLLLHLMATGIVFLLADQLLHNRPVSFLTACLFAVHPIHAEAIGEIVGQADILSTVLGLLAVYIAFSRNRKSTPFLVTALLIAASLAKESAIVFSALVAVSALMPGEAPLHRRICISSCAALVTAATVFLQLSFKRIVPTPIINIAFRAHGGEKILHSLYIIGRAMSMCFVPVGMCAYHDYAAIDLSLATLLPYAIPGALFLCIGIGAFLISLQKKSAAALIGTGLLFGPIIINSSLILPIASELAERLLYPASAAACALMALAVYRIKLSRLRGALAALLVLLFLALSWSAQMPWRKGADLYAYALKAEPLSARLNVVNGMFALAKGDLDSAAWLFMVTTYVLEHFPNRVDPLPIIELEKLPVGSRLLEGPALFAPEDRCGFLGNYFMFLEVETPHLAPLVRDFLLKTYPACDKMQGSPDFRQKIRILPKYVPDAP